MKKLLCSVLVCAAAAATVASTSAAFAQAPNAPPKVIGIFREDVKPAHGLQHVPLEAEYAKHWARFGVAPYLAMEALTGNAAEVLFVSSYASLGDYEKDMAAYSKGASSAGFAALAKQEAEHVSGVRAALATYDEELSYNPDTAMKELPKARFVWIRTLRAKPGRMADLTEMMKANVKAHRDVNLKESFAVYRVGAGAPGGTVLLFQPLASLSEMEAIDEAHKKMREGLSAEAKEKARKSNEDDVAFEQVDLYSLNPRMSHVSPEFAAGDPAFWNPKPAGAHKAEATKPAAAKEPKKP